MCKPKDKKMCVECEERKAVYYSKYERKWRTGKHHNLCPKCYQAQLDAHRAKQLPHVPLNVPLDCAMGL